MAKKTSNQITFIEHKKIIQIKEWYLATSQNSNVTTSTSGWTDTIQTIDNINKYLWNYEEVIYSIGSSDISTPVIIGTYGETGPSLQVKYISSATPPTITNNDVSQWKDIMPVPATGEQVYMIQKMSTSTTWSPPIQISAEEAPRITISDGYWYINGEHTGVKAEGEAPVVVIGSNGNWFINGVDSGNKAQGEAGKDGASVEYVYYRSENAINLSAPSYTGNTLTSGWTSSPQGITIDYQYEYVSVRNKPLGGVWTSFSKPVIWSKWGEKGQDGDGIEYRYYLSNSSTPPTYDKDNTQWKDDPQGVTKDNQYEYVVQIKITSEGSTASAPSLWAKFGADGADGADGVGIQSITNYYAVTNDTEDKPTIWDTKIPALDPDNRYLWNYESVVYTDDLETETKPAIIGVYGDSGENAVMFKIYSVDGFVFTPDITTIKLQCAAFDGSTSIANASFQWYYWDGTDQEYVAISGATQSTYEVKNTNQQILGGLKCVMIYNEKKYEDHVKLSHQVTVYTSTVNFFNGNNTLSADNLYVIAYVELYKNDKLIETIETDKYCNGLSEINGNVITPPTLTDSFSDDDKMYFIYKNSEGLYDVALGKYSSGRWLKQDTTLQYGYTNTFSTHSQSNIIVIPKECINKSRLIHFTVSKEGTQIASTNATVIDVNDPIIASEGPENPREGQLWLDTGQTPNVLKMANSEGKWEVCTEHKGQTVYTSKPGNYEAGDLWIVSDKDEDVDFSPGSMLRANTPSDTFKEIHWEDADASLTSLKNNIEQTFGFDPKKGLTIGQSDKAFYVNIDSNGMGLYDNSDGQNRQVVYIKNNAATIQNAKLKGNTDFYGEINICDPNSNSEDEGDNAFIWKIEANGSLSLAKKGQGGV